jgi:predicted SprT family Zn-dependent metalloprotease
MAKRLALLESKTIELFNRYFLVDWKVKFNRSTIFFGKCVYREKTIYFSKEFIAINSDEELEKTLLHEIAHAISWEYERETGHGSTWQKYCEILGTPAEEFADTAITPNRKYSITIDEREN